MPVVLIVILGLLPIALGCGSTKKAQSGTLPEDGQLWTQPIYFHGYPFSFEVHDLSQAKLILPGGEENSIRCGDRKIISRGGAFFIRDRRYDFESGSQLRIYIPAPVGTVWTHRQDDLEIRWSGSGFNFAIEERNPSFGVRWHCHRGVIELSPQGRVTYRNRSRLREGPAERILSLPARFELDALGNLTGAVSSR